MLSKIAGIEWDGGNWPKCAKYGVSAEEIEDVLAALVFIRTDAKHSSAETRMQAVYRAFSGRHVLLCFTIRDRRGERYLRPISAFYGVEGARRA